MVFDNFSTGHRAAVDPSAQVVSGDIADTTEVERLFDANTFNCVMHLAGDTLVEESMRLPEKYYWSGLCSGLNLLNAMVRHGAKRIVFSSSASVYGDPDSVPINETAATRPQNPYGEVKLIGVLPAWRGRGLGRALLRWGVRHLQGRGGDGNGHAHRRPVARR